jgi:hypothetical protein
VDFIKTAFEAVEPERLEDDAGVLQVARLGIGEVDLWGRSTLSWWRSTAISTSLVCSLCNRARSMQRAGVP